MASFIAFFASKQIRIYGGKSKTGLSLLQRKKKAKKSNAIIANAGNDDVYQIKKQVLPYFFRYYTKFSG